MMRWHDVCATERFIKVVDSNRGVENDDDVHQLQDPWQSMVVNLHGAMLVVQIVKLSVLSTTIAVHDKAS